MNKNSIFLFQIFLVTMQGLIYLFSEKGDVSFLIVNFSALSVILSFLLSWKCRQSTYMRGFGFSIIVFFVLMSWIISFQIPLEIIYGNRVLLEPSLYLVYDFTVINKLVAFSSLMLNFFLLGHTYSYSKPIMLDSSDCKIKIKTYPLLILIFISFFVFFLTFNNDYSHGEVEINSISVASYGFLVKFSAIYLAFKVFNYSRVSGRNSLNFLYNLNFYYLILVAISCFVFLNSHNRIYAIMILSPIIFSYFLFYKKKINVVFVILCFLALNIVGLLFKVYGLADIYKQGLYISDGYVFTKFSFPFTAELAGSFYSGNILFSLWENGFSLYDTTFLVGLFRALPGLMGFLNLSQSTYDSAVIATLYSGVNYGVGTTAIVDLLVNFGPILSLMIFTYIGYFFGRIEIKAYSNNKSIYSYVVFITITILILFYPRASLNDLVGMVLFNLIFCKLYISFFSLRFK